MGQSLSFRKTKIVGTIGPAANDLESLKKLIQAGLNVARLNFSHGTLEEHSLVVERIRKASEELAAPVGILQDLQGPKIRIVGFDSEMTLKTGDSLTLTDSKASEKGKISVDIDGLSGFVKIGQSIFIDDGVIEIKVKELKGSDIICEVIYGGLLKPRKGVNLPDVDLPIDCMTEKDIKDLEGAAHLDFDYVALSFVRTSDDILNLKQRLNRLGSKARVIAKIEKKEAIENIESIIDVSDGIMVARGDLSVEIGQVFLPAVQKRIIKLCNEKGKSVITATQMLESMHVNSRPTRAEITDVANAVLDGSGALMLSGETAFGEHPVRSVETMHDIILEVEKEPEIYHILNNSKKDKYSVPESIAVSAVLCSKQLKAKVIVCLSTTGKTARMISQHRPKAKLIAVTKQEEALCKLELCWGVQTLKLEGYSDTEEAVNKIEALLFENNIAEEGENVVLTLGLPVSKGHKTNSVRVFTMGQRSEREGERRKKGYRFLKG